MNLIGAGVLLILLGGVSGMLPSRRAGIATWVFGVSVLGGCAVSGFVAFQVLSGHPAGTWTFQPTLPGGAWIMGLDGLSAWFLLLLAIVGGVTTVFGATYMERERAHGSVPLAQVAWAILLAGMMGVLVAQSAVLFLVTWEVMAVSAYLLIMFEHGQGEVRRSGLVYLVLTHLGTLGLLVMFLSLGRAAGDFSFMGFAAHSHLLPWARAGILLLALLGFGIKAGMFPFHFWLPGAHAAAPSHVSALLSGVMLKMGVYGLLRIISLMGSPPAWWGWTLLALGLVSAVLGVLWALAQRDIKRALAYSSVENIGIILLGLGLGCLGTAYRHPVVALLGYAAALLHALNHALSKSLLFLGAGAVARATGTREIDRLGGLARRMPRTALAFVAGSIAIVGLPPLNGFVSEWTLVRGFLNAGREAGALRWTSLGAAGIGIVGALSLACFVRLAGTAFLGHPRVRVARDPSGADSALSLPMGVLALACLSIGLAPGSVLGSALRVAGLVTGGPYPNRAIPVDAGPAAGIGLIATLILFVVAGGWVLQGLVLGRTSRRSAPTWGCAFSDPSARMQYTASSFSAPILTAFSLPASPGRTHLHEQDSAGASDRVMRDVARPLWSKVQALARKARPLQQGRVTTYLQYMIWIVIILLGYLLFTSTGTHS